MNSYKTQKLAQSIRVTQGHKRFRFFLFLVFSILFFFSFNSGVFFPSFTKLSDELVLTIAVCIMCSRIFFNLLRKKIQYFDLFFILYIVAQLTNYFCSPFPLKLGLVLLQSIINLKLFIVAITVALIWQDKSEFYCVERFLYSSFIFLYLLGLFLNIALQQDWHFFMGFGSPTYRYGFIRPSGWFGHFAPNSYFFSLTLVTYLYLHARAALVKTRLEILVLFLQAIIEFVMTTILTVRKGLFMVISSFFAFFFRLKLGGKVCFSLFFPFVFLVLLNFIKDTSMVRDTVMNLKYMITSKDNTYIRGLMIFHGVSLFLQFFPLGVGSATFGSVLSLHNTLEVYNYVGLGKNLEWLTDESGKVYGIFDSGLASIMAENGFIGMAFIVGMIFYFFKFNKERLSKRNFFVFKIITLYAVFLSFTEPAWQNGYFTIFYVVNMLHIYAVNGKSGGPRILVKPISDKIPK